MMFLYNLIANRSSKVTTWSGYAFGGFVLIAGAVGLLSIIVIMAFGGEFKNLFNVFIYVTYCVSGLLAVSYASGLEH